MEPKAAPPQPPPAWEIELTSTPEGATVMDRATREALGRTPLRVQLDLDAGKRRLAFKARGFHTRVVELDPVALREGDVKTQAVKLKKRINEPTVKDPFSKY